MGSLFKFETHRRVFDIQSANNLLPLVFRITDEASRKVQDLANLIERVQSVDQLMAKDLESKINETMNRWQTKLEKLGVEPKGMWVADFDSGDGYFCWKYPELEIKFWHGYKDGFTGRLPIKEKQKAKTENRDVTI